MITTYKFELNPAFPISEEFTIQAQQKQTGILLKTNLRARDTLMFERKVVTGQLSKVPITITDRHMRLKVDPHQYFSFHKDSIEPNTVVKGEIIQGDDFELLLYELNINPMKYQLSYDSIFPTNFLIGKYSHNHIVARLMEDGAYEVQLFLHTRRRDSIIPYRAVRGSDAADLIESIYEKVKSACDGFMYPKMLEDQARDFDENLNQLLWKHTVMTVAV